MITCKKEPIRPTGQHAFIHNTVSGQENAIARELPQSRVGDFIDVTRNELAGWNITPFYKSVVFIEPNKEPTERVS
jgi:hypothetical protein